MIDALCPLLSNAARLLADFTPLHFCSLQPHDYNLYFLVHLTRLFCLFVFIHGYPCTSEAISFVAYPYLLPLFLVNCSSSLFPSSASADGVRLERGVPDITCRVLSARAFENTVDWVGVKGTGGAGTNKHDAYAHYDRSYS